MRAEPARLPLGQIGGPWSASFGRDSKTTDRVAVLMDEPAAWALRNSGEVGRARSAWRGDNTAGSATQELWGTQALFDRPALRMAWQVLLRWRSCSDRYVSKGSNMNAAGHPMRYRPENREPADDCCLPGASGLELAELLGVAPPTVDNSIATLGRTTPGNATYGVFLFSRTFIPVRKNYLTRRAGAWRLAAEVRHMPTPAFRPGFRRGQRGRSRLVVPGIPGQRPRASRRLRDRQTNRPLPTDHMTATLAEERPFFGTSFQGAHMCCSRGGVAPRAVVGHDALPPSPVLGYSNTLFLAPSVPVLEKLSAISLSHFLGALQPSPPKAPAEIAEIPPRRSRE
jgi:hypothetical protein